MEVKKINLNGKWYADYFYRYEEGRGALTIEPYLSEIEPDFELNVFNRSESATPIEVPGYWEDMLDVFATTCIQRKISWNTRNTPMRYPHGNYSPDMALPNPYGTFIYKKRFTVEDDYSDCKEIALYMGGVQNAVSVWINGKYLGRHEGYSCEFFINIPKGILNVGENNITLVVSNIRLKGYMGRPISGLTSRAANEATGGIWGDVEIRAYPDGLKDVWVLTEKDLTSFTVKVEGGDDCEKKVDIYDGKRLVCSKVIESGKSEATFSGQGFELWSPNNPKLYTAVVTSEKTRLERRFGIRRLTSDKNRLYLNNKPYFFRGTCEHCYHPVTVHPTRDKNYYRNVLRTLKELGFNSIRFHTYIPMPEYMEAADELGMVFEVETPNNTTYNEWKEIVKACRHYTSVCAYSSGNEMVIDEDYIEHLRSCAELVHTQTDSLFSPISAMRGVEYMPETYGDCKVDTPFAHNPVRLAELDKFCDVYNSYSLSHTSYFSDSGTHQEMDVRNAIYNKPLLSHEICINGTYCDLSLKDRYKGTRIGDTAFMTSVEKHLEDVGLLDKANLYYRNSCAWQVDIRKRCFETLRHTENFAGYDFLGDIDTHWHTFGYCVGMMNEFYELKPNETVRNVLRYNSDVVLLSELPKNLTFESGQKVNIPISVSNYGDKLDKATLKVSVRCDNEVILRREIRINNIENSKITDLYTLSFNMPRVTKPKTLKLCVSLYGGNTDAENEWNLYVFPKTVARQLTASQLKKANLSIVDGIELEDLCKKLENGENVLIFGTKPFQSLPTSFQIAIAGRVMGNLATVVDDHPVMADFPHEGYCSWSFRNMLNNGRAVVLSKTSGKHNPIVDVASSYKNAIRQAAVFEYKVGKGKLFVCSFNLKNSNDVATVWLKNHMIEYVMSEEFEPKQELTVSELRDICNVPTPKESINVNEALNQNDITMQVTKRK